MKEIKLDLINDICEEQDFDELLLEILNNKKKSTINQILQNIDKNKKMDSIIKTQIYEELFDYVKEINEYFKLNIKEVFAKGVKETIVKLNNIYEKELLKGKSNIMKKIKIIIADDNKGVCDLLKKFLINYNDIEILGIANTDEKEIEMIENLKPDIVITDLVRNHKYTGLEIIKEYFLNKKGPEFLVISADEKRFVINNGLEVAGYIKKPINDYEEIYTELKRIKQKLEHNEYLEWDKKYHNTEILEIGRFLTWSEKRILKKLGIIIKNKKYTEYELECLTLDLLAYYDDPEQDLSEEEKQYQKSLEGTNVSREEYNKILNKIEKIKQEL